MNNKLNSDEKLFLIVILLICSPLIFLAAIGVLDWLEEDDNPIITSEYELIWEVPLGYIFYSSSVDTNRFGGVVDHDTFLNFGMIESDGSLTERSYDVDELSYRGIEIKVGEENKVQNYNWVDYYTDGSFRTRYGNPGNTIITVTDNMLSKIGG